MKIQDLLEEKNTGTYAGVHFSSETKEALTDFCKSLNLPNIVPAEKFHSTLLYSRKHCPKYEPLGELNPPWKAHPMVMEIWESQSDTKCLVLKLESPDLTDRHDFLMNEHNATYDFETYCPHITLSYDIEDVEIDLSTDLKQLPTIEIVEEYGEDLDLDWAKNNT